jgi:hypothetical protein
VDDTLIVYKENHTNINGILDKFKSTMLRLTFTLEQEKDITIIKDEKTTFNFYRKPMTTDTIIPIDSCHSISYKLAAIRYFSNKIKTYNLYPRNKQRETNMLKHIIHNNKYDISVLNKVTDTKEKQKQDNHNSKWDKFTYIGKEERFITKFFKNTDVKINSF